MIERQDVVIAGAGAITVATGVELICPKTNDSRPSAITIRTYGGEVTIADFAEPRCGRQADRMVPTCEVVVWNGRVFIIGLPSVVVAGDGAPVKCDLFRKAGEDRGFYATEWIEAGNRLFCIYESGILAWRDGAQPLWHVRKYWDDLLSGVEAGDLVFVTNDGGRFLIAQSDGSRSLPTDSPP